MQLLSRSLGLKGRDTTALGEARCKSR